MIRNRPIRFLLLFACTVAVFCLSATSALAHSQLLGTNPGSGALVAKAPAQVVLTYNEHTTLSFGSIKVFGPDGKRVDTGKAESVNDKVFAPIHATKKGAYAVSWRVISADTHPVQGAFFFYVGNRSGGNVAQNEALNASKTNEAMTFAFAVSRIVYLFGLMALVGGILFSLWGTLPRTRLLRTFGIATVVGLVCAYVLNAAVAGGFSIPTTLHWNVLHQQGTTTYGKGTLLRLILTLATLAAIWKRANYRGLMRGALTVLVLGLACAQSITGHAITTHPVELRLPLDMLHVVVASVWFGGLLQLMLLVHTHTVSNEALKRFSRTAFICVVLVVATGLYASYIEITLSWKGLFDTRYGLFVAGKMALLLLTLPLANANRTRHVASYLKRKPGDPLRTRGLGRYARVEATILVVVVILTALLIQARPAKEEIAPPFFNKTNQLSAGGSLQIVVDPATTAPDEVHLYTETALQQPDPSVTDMTLTITNEERDIGPIKVPLKRTGTGHYQNDAVSIPFTGTWTFHVDVTRGKFTDVETDFHVPINPSTKAPAASK